MFKNTLTTNNGNIINFILFRTTNIWNVITQMFIQIQYTFAYLNFP